MIAWIGWLGMAGAAVLAADALAWPLRLTLLAGHVSLGTFWIRRTVCLRGRRALRSVGWAAGAFEVEAGDRRHRLPATPVACCQRYGYRLWILRFDTPVGRLTAVVDPAALDPEAVRRLGRHLWSARRGELLPSRPKV